jgi:hypothetical protein
MEPEEEIKIKIENEEGSLNKRKDIILLIKIDYSFDPKYNIYNLNDKDESVKKEKDRSIYNLVYEELKGHFDIDKDRVKNIYNGTRNQKVEMNNMIIYFLNEFEYSILEKNCNIKNVDLQDFFERYNVPYENSKYIKENLIRSVNEINNEYFRIDFDR